ncbi:MAG: PEPxxWA-CTERM sorting domain-containing protein, partial [Sphingomicrobium sp.]
RPVRDRRWRWPRARSRSHNAAASSGFFLPPFIVPGGGGGGGITVTEPPPPPPPVNPPPPPPPGPAVPEPATWLMLTIGFGALGGVLRRRRKVEARQGAGALGSPVRASVTA